MDNENDYWNDWLRYTDTFNQRAIAETIIDKMDITTKVRLFEKAIQQGDQRLVLEYISKLKKLDTEQYYEIIKGLYNYFFYNSTFPEEYCPVTRDMLVDLVNYDPGYRKKISDDSEKYLVDDKVKNDDEIIAQVGQLLYDIKSDSYQFFLDFCRNSNNQSVRDVLELFEDRKFISTATYLFSRGEEKLFGGIKGYAYLPEYDTEIKIFVLNRKIDNTSDIENAQAFTFDLTELEAINKGVQFVENSLKTLIELSKRKKLNDDAYSTE